MIVKDMMLTGYDSPPLHTLYLDRPLKGALLMQTLARVNRTFRGKEDGLLVGYAPLAENLPRRWPSTPSRPGEQAGGQEHRRGGRAALPGSCCGSGCSPATTGRPSDEGRPARHSCRGHRRGQLPAQPGDAGQPAG